MGKRRQISYGLFTIRCGWQYWKSVRGNKQRAEKTTPYTYEYEEIYIEGEEEDAWDKVLKEKFKETATKTLYIEDKSLTKIVGVGESLVDKEGNIIRS